MHFGIKSDIIDYGKVRAGWAKVGRDYIPYQLDDVYTINPSFHGYPICHIAYYSQ